MWNTTLKRLTLFGLVFFAAQPAAAAPTEVTWAKINRLTGGWYDAVLSIELNSTFVNPDSCAWGGWYQLDTSVGGAQLFQSMLISAFMAGKEVSLVIDGCTGNRPKIISVSVH
jgi:hypothetical protein